MIVVDDGDESPASPPGGGGARPSMRPSIGSCALGLAISLVLAVFVVAALDSATNGDPGPTTSPTSVTPRPKAAPATTGADPVSLLPARATP